MAFHKEITAVCLRAMLPIVIFAVYCAFNKNEHIVEAKVFYVTRSFSVSRSTPYRPFVIAKTCLLKPDRGPCRAEIPMYYFVPESQSCTPFLWGGCQGNGNRFDTAGECRAACLSRPNQPKTRPKWCSLAFDYGFCFGALERWHYDPLWKTCKRRMYSGCGGNQNNFNNEEQCDSICRSGNGEIRTKAKDRSGIKRIVIVNSPNASTRWLGGRGSKTLVANRD